MAIPSNKEELIIAIESNYKKLKAEIDSIPEDLSDVKTLESHSKGTEMSVKNLLSYLIGWGELVLKWNSKKELNEIVDFPETGYKWNELGKLAQKFYQDYENEDFCELKLKLDSTVEKILVLINSKSNDQLYGISWYKKYTLGKMIQLNTSSPYANARLRLRKWKKEQGFK
ncbi:ClbS/DfsB family four-helix bundle protein [Chryseobacterium scophthalmum]|uniref:ClbS/DfsB family four-helix bundle protein n=1 Tax=Chryseobacterium scophthalmum TaxID=59733 RepID=UPI001AEBD001|nr:ClbS/DfsB family four-helix bundle protein [Chryseobacterium scophthalmum]